MMWQVEGDWASLRVRGLTARLDLCHPSRGLVSIKLDDRAIAGAGLLELRDITIDRRAATPEGFARGADLVVQYAPSANRHYSCHVCWKLIDWQQAGAAGVEAVVSVETALLLTDAAMSVGSAVSSTEILYLAADGTRQPVWDSTADQHSATSADQLHQPGLLLYRLPEGIGSYAEMVHPNDFSTGQVQPPGAGQSHARSVFPLFDEQLEKGVIRRARVRGMFLPTQNDEARALECYRQFAASPTPLSEF